MHALARRLSLALLALTVLVAIPVTAHAVPVATPPADPVATTTPAVAVDFAVSGSETYDAFLEIELLDQPSTGTVELAGPKSCTYPGGASNCSFPLRFTPKANTAGVATFSYAIRNQANEVSAPSIARLLITGSAPTIDAPVMALTGSPWTASLGNITAGSTISWGDGSPVEGLGSASSQRLNHTYSTAGSFTVTVRSGMGDAALSASHVVNVSEVVVGTPSKFVALPGTVTQSYVPGMQLNVNVLEGQIIVTSIGGGLNFNAGQFGYVPSVVRPPVIVPNSPGIQFTPPPDFRPGLVMGTGQVGVTGGGTGSMEVAMPNSRTVDCEVRSIRAFAVEKLYCNSRAGATSRAGRGGAALATPTNYGPPELWFFNASGTLQQVDGSSNPDVFTGNDNARGVFSATLDETSTPKLSELDPPVTFAVIRRPIAKVQSPLRKVAAPKAVNWPKARTRIASGIAFTCPKVSKRSCVVKLRAVSRQFGVRTLVGSRDVVVPAGRTAPLNFTLLQRGRWRLATAGLVATLSAEAVAYQPKPVRERKLFPLRVKLS